MSTLHSLYSNLMTARTVFKDIGRLRRIAAVLIHHGLGYVVQTWHLQDKAILNLLLEKTDPSDHRTIYERVRMVLQELGPTFVKLGQILSTRNDLIPEPLCKELEKLQNQAAPIEWAMVKKLIEGELKKPIEDVFSRFDEVPIGCASISQVHSAQLKTGEEVVVKVRRPNLRETLESDLHLLYFVARQLEIEFPEARAFNPVGIIRTFEQAVYKEVDFRIEARNLKRFANNFKDWTDVCIPRLYPDLTSDGLMVMERLFGTKVTEAPLDEAEKSRVAQRAIAILFKMVFEDGLFHGDLHPGNILILDDGRIGLLDFGMVGRLNHTAREQLADVLIGIATQNQDTVAQILYEISIQREPVSYNAFEAEISTLFDDQMEDGSLGSIDVGALFNRLLEIEMNHQMSLPSEYTIFIKSMISVEGIGEQLCPDLDFMAALRPYAEKIVADRYSPERMMRSAADFLQAVARLGHRMPLSVQRFLRQLEEGQTTLRLESSHEQEIEARKDKRLSRGLKTFVICTLLICGTWMRHDSEPLLFQMPARSLICYLLALLLWLTLYRK